MKTLLKALIVATLLMIPSNLYAQKEYKTKDNRKFFILMSSGAVVAALDAKQTSYWQSRGVFQEYNKSAQWAVSLPPAQYGLVSAGEFVALHAVAYKMEHSRNRKLVALGYMLQAGQIAGNSYGYFSTKARFSGYTYSK
jgi:hypothetical protein